LVSATRGQVQPEAEPEQIADGLPARMTAAAALDGAAGPQSTHNRASALQIGSTPWVTRCLAMEALTA